MVFENNGEAKFKVISKKSHLVKLLSEKERWSSGIVL